MTIDYSYDAMPVDTPQWMKDQYNAAVEAANTGDYEYFAQAPTSVAQNMMTNAYLALMKRNDAQGIATPGWTFHGTPSLADAERFVAAAGQGTVIQDMYAPGSTSKEIVWSGGVPLPQTQPSGGGTTVPGTPGQTTPSIFTAGSGLLLPALLIGGMILFTREKK